MKMKMKVNEWTVNAFEDSWKDDKKEVLFGAAETTFWAQKSFKMFSPL